MSRDNRHSFCWLPYAACLALVPVLVQAKPLVVIEPEVLNFGPISDHLAVTQTILLHNSGSEAVRIHDVRPSCELCLSCVADVDAIPPGGSGLLSITFDPLGYQGFVEQHVALLVGASSPALVRIPVLAEVLPSAILKGSAIHFDDLGPEEERLAQRLISVAHSSGHVIRHAEASEPGFGSRIEYIGQDGVYALDVFSIPPIPNEGLIRGRISLYREEGAEVLAAVPFTALVPPPFYITPGRLLLEPVNREQFRIIFVRQSGGNPQPLYDVSFPVDKFHAKVYPEERDGNYRINVYAFDLGDESGEVGAVVLTFGGSSGREIRIPLEVVDRRRQHQTPIIEESVRELDTRCDEPHNVSVMGAELMLRGGSAPWGQSGSLLDHWGGSVPTRADRP